MSTNKYEHLFKEADASFNGKYKEDLNQLTGLSKDEIDSILPGTEDLRVYSVLVKVVEQASRDHLSQSELIGNIKELGSVAIKIAKKIPSFAALL